MANVVEMVEIPDCQLCGLVEIKTPAKYDAKTIHGPWAYVCETHFKQETYGDLGTGRGQRLVKIEGGE
jgi:hypothetical protein